MMQQRGNGEIMFHLYLHLFETHDASCNVMFII